MACLWALFFLHLNFLFPCNISVAFRWPPLLNHDLFTTCLHCSVHCPPSSAIPSKIFLKIFIQLQACSSYLPTGLRKRMLETDLDFISMTKTCLTQLQRGTYTFPSFGFSQSFHLLRESSSKSIWLTCLFRINTAYYSFCNWVSLSPT